MLCFSQAEVALKAGASRLCNLLYCFVVNSSVCHNASQVFWSLLQNIMLMLADTMVVMEKTMKKQGGQTYGCWPIP